MASLEPDWKDKFLVVGIDVGTTHSGYVWTFLSDYQKDKTNIQVKTWKGERASGKTPTCLLLKVLPTPRVNTMLESFHIIQNALAGSISKGHVPRLQQHSFSFIKTDKKYLFIYIL